MRRPKAYGGTGKIPEERDLREPLGAVEGLAIGGGEGDVPGIAGGSVGGEGRPIEEVGGILDDVALVGLAIEPEVEAVPGA